MRILTTVLLACSFLMCHAQSEKFKAVYLFQFGSIMDWPDPEGNFNIAVVGKTNVIDFLKEIASSKQIDNRAVTVHALEPGASINGMDIVFVTASAKTHLENYFNQSTDQSVLVVADGTGLAQQYAGLSFVESGGKVLFEVNKKVIANSGLFAPSLLERLASKSY